MTKQAHKGKILLVFMNLILALAVLSGTGAAANSSPEELSERGTIIDFEGLAAGTIVDSLSAGKGMVGDVAGGSVKVSGYTQEIGMDTNAAMIFDSACPPSNTPSSCTGNDRDLYKPALGKVLIVSEDMDSTDPDDADSPSATLEFDFSAWGVGVATVESLDVMDIEAEQGQNSASVELYSGGKDGTLVGTVPLPVTGNNGVAKIQVGVSGVDFMRIRLDGSGAVDNIKIRPGEILYLSDEAKRGDGKSHLYRVVLDAGKQQAVMTLLPGGEVNYDQVDTLACTISGSRLYTVSGPTLAYLDMATAQVTEIGKVNDHGKILEKIDQAAFSPDGRLFMTGVETDSLYRVNPKTAGATLIGLITNSATGATLDIQGGDIAFTSDGSLYLWTLRGRTGAPIGLYKVPLTAENGVIKADFIGNDVGGGHTPSFRGIAIRANGLGDLVGADGSGELPQGDHIHVLDKSTGADLTGPYPLTLNGNPFNLGSGDMSIGPFTP